MIDDLDRTLQTLLESELPSDLVDQITISFAMPDDQFPPAAVTLPAVDLFLYDVRENRELRDNDWIVTRSNTGTATKQRPPVRVACSYLITAWASDGSSTPAQDEHRLLGEVMMALLRHSTIPPAMLKGRLEDQAPPLPAITLQPGRLQSLGEFWQALGGKPKAALNYTVTFGVHAQDQIQAPLVTEKVLKFKVEKEADL